MEITALIWMIMLQIKLLLDSPRFGFFQTRSRSGSNYDDSFPNYDYYMKGFFV
jgi:hypothetical protein